jgi:hypothetical protein
MIFIIKTWPDQSATLMTENGYTLASFNTPNEAQNACEAWCRIHGERNFEILTEISR